MKHTEDEIQVLLDHAIEHGCRHCIGLSVLLFRWTYWAKPSQMTSRMIWEMRGAFVPMLQVFSASEALIFVNAVFSLAKLKRPTVSELKGCKYATQENL